ARLPAALTPPEARGARLPAVPVRRGTAFPVGSAPSGSSASASTPHPPLSDRAPSSLCSSLDPPFALLVDAPERGQLPSGLAIVKVAVPPWVVLHDRLGMSGRFRQARALAHNRLAGLIGELLAQLGDDFTRQRRPVVDAG